MSTLGFEQLMFLLRDGGSSHPVIHSMNGYFQHSLKGDVKHKSDLSDWESTVVELLQNSPTVQASHIDFADGITIELGTMGLSKSDYTVIVLKDCDTCVFGLGLGSELETGGSFEMTRDQFWHYLESYPNYNWFKHDSDPFSNWENHVPASTGVLAQMQNGATDARLHDWACKANKHSACSGYSYLTYNEKDNQVGTIGERLSCSSVWGLSDLTSTEGLFVSLTVEGNDYLGYTALLLTGLDLVLLFSDHEKGWSYCTEMSHEGFWQWLGKLPNILSDRKVDFTTHDDNSDVVKAFSPFVAKLCSHSSLGEPQSSTSNSDDIVSNHDSWDLSDDLLDGLDFENNNFSVVVVDLTYSVFGGNDSYQVIAFEALDLVVIYREIYFDGSFEELSALSVMTRKDFLSLLDTMPNHKVVK